MKNGGTFKYRAVLLILGFSVASLYAQAKDTVVQNQESVQQTAPAQPAATSVAPQAPVQMYPPASQSPPPRQTQDVTAPQTVLKGSESDDYLAGKLQGEMDAQGKPIWVLAGLCIGICGVGLAALIPPSPPATAFIGKSGSYIQGYAEGYKSKGRWKNVGMASVGCVISTAINLVIQLAVVP